MKGQDQAISAVCRLIDKGYNIRLYIAGDIEDRSIINEIDSLHSKYIFTLGRVEDMKSLRKSMDLALVCSRSEAFGRVTIESMLSHLPVIGANAGGTTELIDNNMTGLLYHSGNVDDLARCIELLINDSDLYASIVSNAYNFAKKFTIDRTFNEIYTYLD
ncbi:glycosyltransferase [Bifidobacterium pullorum subsp. saeculare DSM 6531 = LMG 14934]|uniref:Glycosyltransferase n=2 Tax=Bifidobacterium pullorum TaxID=78448 RepID=A0A087CPF9_9BIFI|nr:glycosyltransferase [Bifidobacterium pullorum subsp. saeculare DSM 6531 = LMG 14934]